MPEPSVPEPSVPEHWRLIEHHLLQTDAEAPLREVLQHMQEVPDRRDQARNVLGWIGEGLREPWRTPDLARRLRDCLTLPIGRHGLNFSRFPSALSELLEWQQLEEQDSDALQALQLDFDDLWMQLVEVDVQGQDLLDLLSEYLELAHIVLEGALEPLSSESRELLFHRSADFYENWYRGHFPEGETDPQSDQLHEEYLRQLLLEPVHLRQRQLLASAALLRLAEHEFLSGLGRRLVRTEATPGTEEFGADVIAIAGSAPHNRVVLSGRRSSHYQRSVALWIDLGGNDHYQQAAVVSDDERHAAVHIDLKGNDTYSGGERGPASSTGGVAVLVDLRGKDTYQSARHGQAAATLGHAWLVDCDGDDTYELQDYGQGHSLCGIAVLYDLEGDDSYQAWAYAQGAGLGYGLSALVDGDGSDRYLADLHWPDTYGDSGPNIFHAASQGYCTGLRMQVAGGVAALIDLGKGRDRYQAGNFSQGGGYYYSFGLMYDGGGDDENYGCRYAQGFGVHQGIGVRWDRGGNDLYRCRSVAHAGAAWDEAVGLLLEEAGDDVYEVGNLALGGAAQTGVALCIDLDGKDHYQSGGQAQGRTGSRDYHNKPSLGVLFDLGGDADRYSIKAHDNNVAVTSDSVGLFLDTAARDFKKALRAKPRKR